MKKLYSAIMMLAMMVAAVSLTACGGDDDGGNGGDSVSLIGAWECVSVDWGELDPYMSDSNPVGKQLCLNSDYTYTFGSGVVKQSGKWTLSGTTLTIKSAAELVYTITTLTSTNLTIVLSEFGVTYSFKRVK